MNKAIFLDRDGTIIIDKHYLSNPDAIEFLPTAIESLRELSAIGFQLFIVTNQSGVARGYFPLDKVYEVNNRLITLLDKHEIKITEISFCPHHPEGILPEYRLQCTCRKPEPDMITTLAAKHKIDLKHSYMIGDRESDIIAGKKAGCRTIRLNHSNELDSSSVKADFSCTVLKEAVAYIRQNLFLLSERAYV